MKLKSLATVLAASLTIPSLSAGELVLFDGKNPVTFSIPKNVDPVVKKAAEMFVGDMEAVTGMKARETKEGKAVIRLVELDKAGKGSVGKLRKAGVPIDSLATLTDGFSIIADNGSVYVVGANGRGTAYGLLEMSRLAGVSPWIWWGDLHPEKKERLTIDDGFNMTQGASVERRGVFLNDEDWSLRPWSYMNYEPSDKTEIGTATYRKIFELLLRLRGNTIWPAMHEGTTAFFQLEGAKAAADSCGIIVGSSHCEPLLRNNVGEWNVKERGRFNYRTNRDEVHNYWIDRLKEVKGSAGGNMFTIGMRGIHDSSMEGYKTEQEKFDALQQVIDVQQGLIGRYVGDPSKQDQVFVPYKEVLELYEKGLKVPDYVTLMWCDDNYGYITRLSKEDEQKRKGGGGVYYHLSYWGRPHDHLWLTTTQPGLIYNEMRSAYDHNVRKLWIANVHDPKVAGYDLELFLDMAWNIDGVKADNIDSHYKAWLTRQFGKETAERIFPAMMEFYRLCGERKPEFMGWSQTELDKRTYDRGLSPVSNSEFSQKEFGGELDRYLQRFERIANIVNDASSKVRPELADAYFAAVIYPVNAASAHAHKILESQKARQLASGGTPHDLKGRDAAIKTASARSQAAYQELRRLTEFYNDSLSGGKWKGLMDMRPRDLPVFCAPSVPVMLTDSEIAEWKSKGEIKPAMLDTDGTVARNASDYDKASGKVTAVKMLGHSMNAVNLPKGEKLSYNFNVDKGGEGVVKIALIPTQPNDGGDIRFSVSVDGAEPVVFSLKEPFRSERWKKNVLRGQAVRELPVELAAGKHTLEIKALDDHIVVDQWMYDHNRNRKFYLFPVE